MIKVLRSDCNGNMVPTVCSAVVVFDNTLLTAAHCIASLCKDTPVKLRDITTPLFAYMDDQGSFVAGSNTSHNAATAAIAAVSLSSFTGVATADLANGAVTTVGDLALIQFEPLYQAYLVMGKKVLLKSMLPPAAGGAAVAQSAAQTHSELRIVGFGDNGSSSNVRRVGFVAPTKVLGGTNIIAIKGAAGNMRIMDTCAPDDSLRMMQADVLRFTAVP